MSLSALEAIRIVLVGTSHPGNIGAVARAMWTMGLHRLALVAPVEFPCAEATARAAGADEVLYRASVHAELIDAIGDCTLVIGTTARERRLPFPEAMPRAAAARAVEAALAGTEVALVFGRERTGLTNEELDLCHLHVTIPTNPAFRSLNLASAVQVVSYECRLAALDAEVTAVSAGAVDAVHDPDPLASALDLDRLQEHLEAALVEIDYLDPDAPRLLRRRLRRLVSRLGLRTSELAILRGVLAAAQRQARLARR
ncbi:MAG: TrmJ/YjtD family RNA methyltransferase [Ectothiorhodospiraceae bacterium]|nr:TrmJ/YjtD family RNA methyltransferase [Chromatiales bacterium]MCP5157143.1 TrmJ/YjtD family RNA methyltransferase [Ectothiorhodospiraceae bacterium]